MSDFTNGFWPLYVAIISLVSILACAWVLWVAGKTKVKVHAGQIDDNTTGHVWDEDVRELNNPLPRWWMPSSRNENCAACARRFCSIELKALAFPAVHAQRAGYVQPHPPASMTTARRRVPTTVTSVDDQSRRLRCATPPKPHFPHARAQC